MNKKLVALAVAGVLSAPLAAQAQTANVTLYGRVNMTVEAVQVRSQPEGVSEPWIYRVNSNSSRLGVRGTESLGGGLNAIFQIESNVSADTGVSGGLGNRETFVGLQGGWGTVKIGNFLAPYDDIHPIFGNVPTLATTIMSTASLWSQGAVPKALGGFDARLGNSVRYDSPNFSGFTGSIQCVRADRIGQPQRHGVFDGRLLQQRPVASRYGLRAQPERSRHEHGRPGLLGRRCLQLRHRARRGGLRASRLRHPHGRPEARPVRRVGDGEPRTGPDVFRLDPRRQRQGQLGGRHAGRRPGQGQRLRVRTRSSSRTRTRCRSAR